MKTNQLATFLITGFIICLCLLSYCHYCEQATPEENNVQDTLFLNQWRKEKSEKQKLLSTYTQKIQQLNQSEDSLNFILSLHKDLLKSYRYKTKELSQQLQNKQLRDSSQKNGKIILPILDSLIKFQDLSDSACDINIANLESSLANRDSTIRFYVRIESTLKDLQKQQDLNNQVLTQQLNTAYKMQKKKARQNKLLSGGLLILSGITSALFITQTTK